jgi:hypothetical protein
VRRRYTYSNSLDEPRPLLHVETRAEGDYGLKIATLALDVANALKRMWKVEDEGALQTWHVLTEMCMAISNIDR